jgi:hypothetical protein
MDLKLKVWRQIKTSEAGLLKNTTPKMWMVTCRF